MKIVLSNDEIRMPQVDEIWTNDETGQEVLILFTQRLKMTYRILGKHEDFTVDYLPFVSTFSPKKY